MSKATKVWLIIASSLLLIGCIICGGAMAMLNWDFTKLSTTKYDTNTYTIQDDFQNITIVTDTADIKFVPSDNQTVTVTCYEQKNLKHSVAVKGDTLTIEINDTRKWYEYIHIGFGGSPKITVSIPQGDYGKLSIKANTGDTEIPKDFKFATMEIVESTGDVTSNASVAEAAKIKTSTGDIRVENISAGSLDLSVTTGDITINNITCVGSVKVGVSTGKTHLTKVMCESLNSTGNTGDISLKNVIATETFIIERSTGYVKLDSCDAGEIFITTDTGDVTGSLLTDKIFLARTDTGRIDVPRSVTGGRCEITTDTGNIIIRVG